MSLNTSLVHCLLMRCGTMQYCILSYILCAWVGHIYERHTVGHRLWGVLACSCGACWRVVVGHAGVLAVAGRALQYSLHVLAEGHRAVRIKFR